MGITVAKTSKTITQIVAFLSSVSSAVVKVLSILIVATSGGPGSASPESTAVRRRLASSKA